MFDPIAFENMKVVLEGAFYDLDLNDELVITSRHDLIDLADMSRKYIVSCSVKGQDSTSPECKLSLLSDFKSIASEKLTGFLVNRDSAGCTLSLSYNLPIIPGRDWERKAIHLLHKTWKDHNPEIALGKHSYLFKKKEKVYMTIEIIFKDKLMELDMPMLEQIPNSILHSLILLNK